MLLFAPHSDPSLRLTDALRRGAYLSFAAYLAMLLGFSSIARTNGPLAWLPIWRLPDATDTFAAVGVVSLLPLLSVAAWLAARIRTGGLRTLTAGWRAFTYPLAALAALGLLRTLLPCLSGSCDLTALLRLSLLLAHLGWVYLYIVNEKPPLFPIVVAIIALQSIIAIGQFVGQSDLGLTFLGEIPLDPEVRGISVVMRGPERWLRAYGLTNHPNSLAAMLVTLLWMLPVLRPRLSPVAFLIGRAAFILGFAALLTTLARWAMVCFTLGAGVHLFAWFRAGWASRRWTIPKGSAATGLALAAVLIGFLTIYGDAAASRVVALDTPIESRSLMERERDTDVSRKVIAANPLGGVGLGNYVAEARAYDPWAETVHNMPLLLSAELGLGGFLVWTWLLVAPVARRGAFSRYAAQTALWLSFWLLGILYNGPHPLYELRSTLLVGLAAGLISVTAIGPPRDLPAS
jgi:hypothetical protein